MNDDFLHRMRKAPPPEFLDGLKARIERQSPLARTKAPRFPFARGLIVGLLLGSAAFAVTSLAVNRAPASVADFLKAPVQLIASLGNRSSQGERPTAPGYSLGAGVGAETSGAYGGGTERYRLCGLCWSGGD